MRRTSDGAGGASLGPVVDPRETVDGDLLAELQEEEDSNEARGRSVTPFQDSSLQHIDATGVELIPPWV